MKYLNKILQRLRSWREEPLNVTPMWFLECSDLKITQSNFPQWIKKAFMDLRRDGFTILEGNVSHELCDQVVEDFYKFCETNEKSKDFRDKEGLYSRVALLHYISKPALKLGTNAAIKEFLSAAFLTEFTIVGSLFFEKGSAQNIHRDTPAFFTNPLNHFFSVWTALEDIQAGSGELCYYGGGHLVARDADLYNNKAINFDNYFSTVEDECKKAGLKKQNFLAKKGDTLIWIPELPHGGAERVNKNASRKSIVFHYLPKRMPIHNAGTFFSRRGVYVNQNYDTRCVN